MGLQRFLTLVSFQKRIVASTIAGNVRDAKDELTDACFQERSAASLTWIRSSVLRKE